MAAMTCSPDRSLPNRADSSHAGPTAVRRRSSSPSAFPFVAVALLLVVQVGLVAHDQVLVVHAAREAARAAAVGSPPPALDGLDPSRTEVEVDRGGGRVRVRVRYRSATAVPIVGPLVAEVVLVAETTMRDERTGSGEP